MQVTACPVDTKFCPLTVAHSIFWGYLQTSLNLSLVSQSPVPSGSSASFQLVHVQVGVDVCCVLPAEDIDDVDVVEVLDEAAVDADAEFAEPQQNRIL